MARRPRLMQAVEERYNRPLERLLPEMVNEKGISGTAAGARREQVHRELLASEARHQRSPGGSSTWGILGGQAESVGGGGHKGPHPSS